MGGPLFILKFKQLVNPLHSIEQVLRDGAFDRLAKIVSRACLPIRRQWRREPETLKLRRPSQVTNKGGPSGMGRAFHMPAVCTGFTRISVDLPADSLQTKHMQLRRASRGHSGCQCMSKRCQLYCTRVLSGTMVSRIALAGGQGLRVLWRHLRFGKRHALLLIRPAVEPHVPVTARRCCLRTLVPRSGSALRAW